MPGSWVTAAPFRQGMGAPVCHSLHPIHFTHVYFLPGSVGTWFSDSAPQHAECVSVCVCVRARAPVLGEGMGWRT